LRFLDKCCNAQTRQLLPLYKDPKAWHPDVDDLDIPEGESSALLLAAKLLKVEFPESVKTEIDRLSTPAPLLLPAASERSRNLPRRGKPR
jgi:hypothetical protein